MPILPRAPSNDDHADQRDAGARLIAAEQRRATHDQKADCGGAETDQDYRCPGMSGPKVNSEESQDQGDIDCKIKLLFMGNADPACDEFGSDAQQTAAHCS
jgi:hypothetical protein